MRADIQAILAARPSTEAHSRSDGAVKTLSDWGERVGLRARDAIHLGGNLTYLASAIEDSGAISRYFGTGRPAHAFNSEPHHWLRMTELQSTKGLARFLSEDAPRRVLAFMRALAPKIVWPGHLDRAWADAEVRTRHGRIDLLLRGQAGPVTWGAVVEAKFDHHASDNPLADYRRAALSLKLRPIRSDADAFDGGAILAILGRTTCAATDRRLARNRDWRFVAWRPVLERFERGLAGLPDDEDFRRFRRTLWERSR